MHRSASKRAAPRSESPGITGKVAAGAGSAPGRERPNLNMFTGVSLTQPETGRRTVYWLDRMIFGLRLAIRSILRSPGFALSTIATLALGVGANTGAFSALHSLLLKPLPYPD